MLLENNNTDESGDSKYKPHIGYAEQLEGKNRLIWEVKHQSEIQMSQLEKFMIQKINKQTQPLQLNYEREIQNLKNKCDQKCKSKGTTVISKAVSW